MKAFLKKLLDKLTSRKFLMCIAIVAVGILMAFGVTTNDLAEIIGMLTTLFGGLTYIVTEAGLDKANMKVREAEAKAEIAKANLKAEEVKAGIVTK